MIRLIWLSGTEDLLLILKSAVAGFFFFCIHCVVHHQHLVAKNLGRCLHYSLTIIMIKNWFSCTRNKPRSAWSLPTDATVYGYYLFQFYIGWSHDGSVLIFYSCYSFRSQFLSQTVKPGSFIQWLFHSSSNCLLLLVIQQFFPLLLCRW